MCRSVWHKYRRVRGAYALQTAHMTSPTTKIPFCYVVESASTSSSCCCGACRRWWGGLSLMELFFFFLFFFYLLPLKVQIGPLYYWYFEFNPFSFDFLIFCLGHFVEVLFIFNFILQSQFVIYIYIFFFIFTVILLI